MPAPVVSDSLTSSWDVTLLSFFLGQAKGEKPEARQQQIPLKRFSTAEWRVTPL